MHVLLTRMRFMKADFYFSLFVTKLRAILSSAITGAEKMVCNQRRTEAGASHFFGLCIYPEDSKISFNDLAIITWY